MILCDTKIPICELWVDVFAALIGFWLSRKRLHKQLCDSPLTNYGNECEYEGERECSDKNIFPNWLIECVPKAKSFRCTLCRLHCGDTFLVTICVSQPPKLLFPPILFRQQKKVLDLFYQINTIWFPLPAGSSWLLLPFHSLDLIYSWDKMTKSPKTISCANIFHVFCARWYMSEMACMALQTFCPEMFSRCQGKTQFL